MTHGSLFVAPVPGAPPLGMSATDARLAMGGIFGLTPQLVSGGGVVQSGSNMNVTVAAAVWQIADVTNAAATFFAATDSTVLTPAAGPGTGSRKDLICVRAHNYENGDADSQAATILVPGTAGSPGVDPVVPAGYYKYAEIAVPTSAATASACTVTVYGNTTFAPPLLNTPSFAALSLGVGILNQKAYSAADGITYRWNGTIWHPWESDWVATTPTVTSAAGAFTTVACALRARYVAGAFQFRAKVTITTAGTATSAMIIPLGITAVQDSLATGYEEQASSLMGAGTIGPTAGSTSSLYFYKYDGTTAIASGRTWIISGFAEV